jgi:hypothetical protein
VPLDAVVAGGDGPLGVVPSTRVLVATLVFQFNVEVLSTGRRRCAPERAACCKLPGLAECQIQTPSQRAEADVNVRFYLLVVLSEGGLISTE